MKNAKIVPPQIIRPADDVADCGRQTAQADGKWEMNLQGRCWKPTIKEVS